LRRTCGAGWLAVFIILVLGMPGAGHAKEEPPKRTLNADMTEVYTILPPEVTRIGDMFSQGVFYGRLRINHFRWNWRDTIPGKTRDNWSIGMGGSAIYKTAYLYGLGMTAGLYTSQNPWHMDHAECRYNRSGKDVFSRHKVATGDGYGMTVLAQAYVEFKFFESNIRAGRQIFESLLTASNDTKMIPNTFEGISISSQYIPDTSLKAACFTRHKLRDHTRFHHVFAYGDDPRDPYANWKESDDSAMHRGITRSKLHAENITDRLIIVEATNRSLPGLSIMANTTMVPELFWTATGELNYRFALGNGVELIPGFRYLQQFDRKAGEIGGASIKGVITPSDNRGYHDPNSMDGKLYAARINVKKGAGSVQVGYSRVADEADILAPWRGFPTGGYTRPMAQLNWYAATKTLMFQVEYDFDKAGFVPGLSAMIRYAIQDFDDKKPDVPSDFNVFTLDLIENLSILPGLSFKGRFAVARGDDHTRDRTGEIKTDPSYNEYRFEMNYLF